MNLPKIEKSQPALELVIQLCRELDARKINYCHWKSNSKLDRSASGENDLDLLISRSCVQQFTEILYRLGFKQAFSPPEAQLPGVLDYYGFDQATKKFVHVHAHYQLIMGHDATKNYHLPIERQYLESIVHDRLFNVPAVEFEFIILVIRMMIKHSTWDVVLLGNAGLSDSERQELAYLQERISQSKLIDILKNTLPSIDVSLFSKCHQSLISKTFLLSRIRTGGELRRQLRANARRSWTADIFLKFWRRFAGGIQRRVFSFIQ